MAEDKEPMLRNALDAVNTSRKWMILGVSSLFFAVTITLAVLSRMIMPPGQHGITVDVPAGASAATPTLGNGLMPIKALWVFAAFQLLFVACGTIAVMLHVSRMTRAILRAIESTRK